MQIVIEIPEDKYDLVKLSAMSGVGDFLHKAVAKGTPLPKGHGDLIDKNNLHTVLDYHMHNIDGIHEIIDTDEDIKTIIEADKGE